MKLILNGISKSYGTNKALQKFSAELTLEDYYLYVFGEIQNPGI